MPTNLSSDQPSAREGHVPTGNARLYHRDISDGLPILVLHGDRTSTTTYLLPEMDRLADSFRLIYYDQRGRGRSSDGVQPGTLTSDPRSRTWSRSGATSSWIRSHSWGGLLAMEHATRNPDRVSHLILMNTAPASRQDSLLLRQHLLRIRPPSDVQLMEALASDDRYQRGDLDEVLVDPLRASGSRDRDDMILAVEHSAETGRRRCGLRRFTAGTGVEHGDIDVPCWGGGGLVSMGIGVLSRMRVVAVAAICLLAVACDTAPEGTPGEPSDGDPAAVDATPPSVEPAEEGASDARAVEPVLCSAGDGSAWRNDATVGLSPIGSENGVDVFAAEYPHPGETTGLWSQWGQGIVTVDGRHISAVGDHLGVDGNSYLYVYDPDDRSLTRFMDVLSLVDHQPGAWGYGKIHAQMVTGPCDSIWVFTYWGTRSDIRYGAGYDGDLLLEIDPVGETVANHGPVAGTKGVPALAATGDGRYLVAEAVDAETDIGELVVYDTGQRTVVDRVDDPVPVGHRAIAVDHKDRVLYSVGGDRVVSYDPAAGTVSDVDVRLPSAAPGDFLRAATPPTSDGTVFGVTQDERIFFALRADGGVHQLAPADGYTTSIAMTPDGERLFWLPDAHGSAWETGAVVRALDTGTGEVSEIVSLRSMFEEKLGLLPGGTYSMAYSDGRLFIGVNASASEDDSGFGTVVLVVVEGL